MQIMNSRELVAGRIYRIRINEREFLFVYDGSNRLLHGNGNHIGRTVDRMADATYSSETKAMCNWHVDEFFEDDGEAKDDGDGVYNTTPEEQAIFNGKGTPQSIHYSIY